MSERGVRVAQAAALAALIGWTSAVHAQSGPYDSGGSSIYASEPIWSATAARTAGRGNNLLQVEAGWPGIGFTYQRGLDSRSDFGARVSFLYSFEGTTNSRTGVQLQTPYRRMLTSGETANITFHFDPGVTVHSGSGGTLVGVGGPIGVLAGWDVSPWTSVDVGVDFPILFSFSNPAGVWFGPMLGGGLEYAIDRNLHVTLRVRMGPDFSLGSGQSGSQFAFLSLIGLAYNMR
jgi:hypothetical protein